MHRLQKSCILISSSPSKPSALIPSKQILFQEKIPEVFPDAGSSRRQLCCSRITGVKPNQLPASESAKQRENKIIPNSLSSPTVHKQRSLKALQKVTEGISLIRGERG